MQSIYEYSEVSLTSFFPHNVQSQEKNFASKSSFISGHLHKTTSKGIKIAQASINESSKVNCTTLNSSWFTSPKKDF